MIAVAGGTGRLGTLLVRRLVDHGEQVRVLTREPARADHLAALRGVETVRADVRDASDVMRAVAAADTIVSAVHGFAGSGGGSPESIDRDGNVHLIDAARSVGAAFILTSTVGAAPDSPMELFRAKYAAEEYLRRSGVPFTIVRATAFVETWASIMGDPRTAGKLLVLGRGDNAVNFVSVVDVAALLEQAVADATLRGRTIEIGGPENLTFNQLASILQEAAGTRCTVRHVPRAMLRLMGEAARLVNPAFARQARAAVVMDTHDFAFDGAARRTGWSGVPLTDVKTALRR